MKKKKKDEGYITAGELMARLEKDPEYQARMAAEEKEMAEKKAKLRELQKPVFEDLQRIGVVASSLPDLIHKYAPLPKEIVQILLKWVPVAEDEDIQEWLVRALAGTRVKYDGSALIELFEKTQSETLRWVIANTLESARPLNVTEWVIDAVMNPSYGDAREMLALAVARLAPKEIANERLIAIFDEFPGHAAAGLAKTGGKRELEFLEAHREGTKGWVKREINKAIKSINKRLERT